MTHSLKFTCCFCEIKCLIYCNDNVTQYLNLLITRRCQCDSARSAPRSSSLAPPPHNLCKAAPLYVWRRQKWQKWKCILHLFSYISCSCGFSDNVFASGGSNVECNGDAIGDMFIYSHLAAEKGHFEVVLLPVQTVCDAREGITKCGFALLYERDVNPTEYPNIKSQYSPARFVEICTCTTRYASVSTCSYEHTHSCCDNRVAKQRARTTSFIFFSACGSAHKRKHSLQNTVLYHDKCVANGRKTAACTARTCSRLPWTSGNSCSCAASRSLMRLRSSGACRKR
jgi:hypothetical protein